MRLLFDQNLSRHLCRHLATEYADSRHVTDVGLHTATDAEVWAWAGEHGYVIVSVRLEGAPRVASQERSGRQLCLVGAPERVTTSDRDRTGQEQCHGHRQPPCSEEVHGTRQLSGSKVLALPAFCDRPVSFRAHAISDDALMRGEVGNQSEEPLTRERLAQLFAAQGVDPGYYSLFGASYNDADVLFQLPLGRWEVFYFERGSKRRVMTFDDEDAACREMLRRVLGSP